MIKVFTEKCKIHDSRGQGVRDSKGYIVNMYFKILQKNIPLNYRARSRQALMSKETCTMELVKFIIPWSGVLVPRLALLYISYWSWGE